MDNPTEKAQKRFEQVDDLHFSVTFTVDDLTPDEKERAEKELEEHVRALADRMTGFDYGFGIRWFGKEL